MIDPANPIFQDDDKAREFLELQRWSNGPVCPHCHAENAGTKLQGKSTRPGVYKCKKCEKPYTVTVGTVFERSKVPLRIWLYATFLLTSSKKGMSAHQLHRMIGVQYKTAHFMFHRIREAMRTGSLSPMGGAGTSGVVEADETYTGRKPGSKKQRGTGHKHAVVSIVERGGKVRSVHVANLRADTVVSIVNESVAKDA